MKLDTLTPAEIGIVKLAAAQRMKELVPNLRPETADYIFAREVMKQACEAGAGNTPNLASKSSPAKIVKNPAVKAAPKSETIAANGGTLGPKGASAQKLAKAITAAIAV